MYIYLRVCVLVFLQYNIYIYTCFSLCCIWLYLYAVYCHVCMSNSVDAFMCARLGACFATSKTLPRWVGFIGKIQPIRILPSDPAWACPIKLIKACQCVQAVSIVGGVQVSSNNVRFDCHSSHAKRTIQQLGKNKFSHHKWCTDFPVLCLCRDDCLCLWHMIGWQFNRPKALDKLRPLVNPTAATGNVCLKLVDPLSTFPWGIIDFLRFPKTGPG